MNLAANIETVTDDNTVFWKAEAPQKKRDATDNVIYPDEFFPEGTPKPISSSETIQGITDRYTHNKLKDLDLSLFIFEERGQNQPSNEFVQLIRANFVPQILTALEDVQPHAQSPNALVYIDEILTTIKHMEIECPN
ncbi:MAG: hypothetical protein HQ517_11340, partial [SAR324 cluster bacterium]|nr:hypothetical protein [SAR324 cluster bacterium]